MSDDRHWARAGKWGRGVQWAGDSGVLRWEQVTWAPRGGWSVSARGYVLKGLPAASFAPLARPAGWGVPTSGPERGRLSLEDSWDPVGPSLEDLGLFSGPTRRLSPLPPPASLRLVARPRPPAFSGDPLAVGARSSGIPFSWRGRPGGGGLSLRRELERVTDIFSNSSSSSVRAPSLAPLLPRTMVWGPGHGRVGARQGGDTVRASNTETGQHNTHTETRQRRNEEMLWW
jgi:hypothetical protein